MPGHGGHHNHHHHHHPHHSGGYPHHRGSLFNAIAVGYAVGSALSSSSRQATRASSTQAPVVRATVVYPEPTIHDLIERGSPQAIALLQNNPLCINLIDAFGRTPLMVAAQYGHLHIVQDLLSRPGILIDAVNIQHSSYTALHYALKNKQLNIARLLISATVNLYHSANPYIICPIHLAARYGTVEIVQDILNKAPAHINQPDPMHQTPLIHAANAGNREIVEYLMTHYYLSYDSFTVTFDKNHQDINKTALEHALTAGHSDIAVLLLNRIPSEGIKRLSGPVNSNLAHYAAETGNLTFLTELLHRNPTLFFQQNDQEQTPLILAAKNGHYATVEFLLRQAGVDVNAPNNIYNNVRKTALHFAAENGHSEIVRLLLSNNAKLGLHRVTISPTCDTRTRGLLQLQQYIDTRETQDRYKTKFTLFGHTFNFGYTKEEKLNTASLAKRYVLFGDQTAAQQLRKNRNIFEGGELGKASRNLEVKFNSF